MYCVYYCCKPQFLHGIGAFYFENKAMSSIEDALSLRNQLQVQETRLRKELELARKSELLNEVRYRHGAARISFWLDAQEKRRQAELRLDENRFNQLQNLAKIYLEFGGAPAFP